MFYPKTIEDLIHWSEVKPSARQHCDKSVLFILYKIKCLKDEEILVFHNM